MPEAFTYSADFDFSKGYRTAAEAQKKIEALNFSKIKLDFDSAGLNKLSGPLGRLSGQASEFSKSLEASNARVLAFGSSVGILAAVSKGMKDLATNGIEVQKILANINVVLNLSKSGLESYSKQLFDVARNTGSNFKDIAEGAKELARQGLGAAESLKRLNDAAILSRLSGQSLKESVGTLTSVINSYNKEVITSTDLTNKLASISSRFAISGKDIADALQRVGSSAQDAGVNIDQLIALITSAQHITNRGGDVIGNALKSIFQRVQRNDTVDQLQAIGVAARDVAGNTRSAVDILKSLSDVYPNLNKSQQTFITELTGGVFQANQLKAVINDLSTGYSTYKSALDDSINSTDTAIKQNAKLNQTLASNLNVIGQNYKQATGKFGELAISPVIKKVVSTSDLLSETFVGSGKGPETSGQKFAEGFFKGIGNFVAGPGTVIFSAIIVGLLRKSSEFTKGAIKNLIDVAVGNERVATTQQKINQLLQAAGTDYQKLIAGANSLAEVELRIAAIRERSQGLSNIKSSLAIGIAQRESAGSLAKLTGRVNNYADPLQEAINREKISGVSEKDIYVDTDKRLISPSNPMGLLVANKRDEPLGGFQGVNRALAMGANPNIAQKIPNYAAFDSLSRNLGVNESPFSQFLITPEQSSKLRSLFGQLTNSVTKIDKEVAYGLGSSIEDYIKEINLTKESQAKIRQTVGAQFNRLYKLEQQPKIFIGGKLSKGGSGGGEGAGDLESTEDYYLRQTREKQNREASYTPAERARIAAANKMDRALSSFQSGDVDESGRLLKIKKTLESKYSGLRGTFRGTFEDQLPEDNAAIRKALGVKRLSGQERIFAESERKQILQNRRSRVTGIGFGASLGGSLLSGAFEGPTSDIINDTAAGLSLGALTGNPVGLAVGAGAGLAYGAGKAVAGAPDRAFKKAADEFEKMSAAISASTNSAENYVRTQQQLNEVLQSGAASEKDINTLTSSLTTLFSEITDNRLKQDILSAGDDINKLGDKLSEFAKKSREILAEKAIGVSSAGALAQRDNKSLGFGGNYRTEDLVTIGKNVAQSGKINSSNIGEFQAKFDELSKTINESKLEETIRAIGVPIKDITDYYARLNVLSSALGEAKLGKQAEEITKDLNAYLVALSNFQKEFRRLIDTRLNEQKITLTGDVATNNVRSSAAKSVLSGLSYGLTDSSIARGEGIIQQRALRDQTTTGLKDIKLDASGKIASLITNVLQQSASDALKEEIGKTDPDKLIQKILNLDTKDFKGGIAGEDIGKVKNQLYQDLIDYEKTIGEFGIKQKEATKLLDIEINTRLAAIRRQALIGSFGGVGNLGKSLDTSPFVAASQAASFRAIGEYQLGRGDYVSNNQKAVLQNQTARARLTESQSAIELAKLFPEIAAVRTPAIQAKVSKSFEFEDRQKLAQLTADQLKATFKSELTGNGIRTQNLSVGTLEILQQKIFNALSATGPNGQRRPGGDRNYDGALKILDDSGIKTRNPELYDRFASVLSQAQQIQGNIPDAAKSKAKLSVPGLLSESDQQKINEGYSSDNNSAQVAINTAVTARRLEDIKGLLAVSNDALLKQGEVNKLRGDAQKILESAGKKQQYKDALFDTGYVRLQGDQLQLQSSFKGAFQKVSGKDYNEAKSLAADSGAVSTGEISIFNRLLKGGNAKDIFKDVKDNLKDNDAFLQVLSPDVNKRDDALKLLIAQFTNSKLVKGLEDNTTAINELNKQYAEKNKDIDTAGKVANAAKEASAKATEEFGKKQSTAGTAIAGSGSAAENVQEQIAAARKTAAKKVNSPDYTPRNVTIYGKGVSTLDDDVRFGNSSSLVGHSPELNPAYQDWRTHRNFSKMSDRVGDSPSFLPYDSKTNTRAGFPETYPTKPKEKDKDSDDTKKSQALLEKATNGITLDVAQKIQAAIQVTVNGAQNNEELKSFITASIGAYYKNLQGQIDELKGGIAKPSAA